MEVAGRPQNGANDLGHRCPPSVTVLIFSAHLIDDCDEIRERFVAHGRIRPMWSKRQEGAIEVSIRRRPQGACLQNIPVLGLGLHGVQDTVGFERFDRLDEG
jgi:hypothetical protein